MAHQDLTPLRSLSKSQEVFERLREAICSGDLEPGAPLREAHIAKQLNVSQVPVREALLQLENLGLVLRVPDRGTTVTRLTRSEIAQMMDVRCHLEVMAFQLASQRLSVNELVQLKAHLKEIQKLASERSHLALAEEDFAFHRAVWKASGNAVLERTLERTCVAVYAFVSLKRHLAGETIRSAYKSHKVLFDALVSRDTQQIEAAVRQHINSSNLPATILD